MKKLNQYELMHLLEFNINYNNLIKGKYYSDNKGWVYHHSDNQYFKNYEQEHNQYNDEMKDVYNNRIFNQVLECQPELKNKLDEIWKKAHTFVKLPYFLSIELKDLINIDSVKSILFKKHLDFTKNDESIREKVLQNFIDEDSKVFLWLHTSLQKNNFVDDILFELYIKNLNKYENLLKENNISDDACINVLLLKNLSSKSKNIKRLKLIIQKDTKKKFGNYIEKSFENDFKTNYQSRILFKTAYNKNIYDLDNLMEIKKLYEIKIKVPLNDIFDHLNLNTTLKQSGFKFKYQEVLENEIKNVCESKKVFFDINTNNTFQLNFSIKFYDLNLEHTIENTIKKTNHYFMDLLKRFNNNGDELLNYSTEDLTSLMKIYLTKDELTNILNDNPKNEVLIKRKNKI